MQTVIFICPQWSYRNISHFTYPIPIPLMVIYPLHCPLLKNKAWKTSLDKSEMWIASYLFSWSNPTTHWGAASTADVWFIRGNATVGGVSKYNQWIQPTFQWCRLSLADTAGWEWPLEMGVIDTAAALHRSVHLLRESLQHPRHLQVFLGHFASLGYPELRQCLRQIGLRMTWECSYGRPLPQEW